jgi:hypothetical protein
VNRLLSVLPLAGIVVAASFFTSVNTLGQESGAQVEETKRSYPSFSGGVRQPPPWVVEHAPFDVTKFFQLIPDDENAALLYLDALYEFSPGDMARCIDPEVQVIRGPSINERAKRTGNVMAANPPVGDAALRSRFVAEYSEAFDKLALAQKRPRCMFETGVGILALLPHAQSSRQVVRLLDWRVEALVTEGKIDAALDDIALGLRLCRDLRPRGFQISQLVSFALDGVTTSSLIPRVLGAPRLTVEQCDRLLEILIHHDTATVDPLGEGFRMEYVMCRDLLHQLETEPDAIPPTELSAPARAALKNMIPADFVAEIELLNQYFEPLIERGSKLINGEFQLQPAQQAALDKMQVLAEFVVAIPQAVEACRRDRTRLDATHCLAAVRRWQLQTGKAVPPDLETVCRAAGIKSVPIDRYASMGHPLRSIVSFGEFVVYSVGKDGNDDEAGTDWEFGKQAGDWIFRLPEVP